jgi:hypothetical protein
MYSRIPDRIPDYTFHVQYRVLKAPPLSARNRNTLSLIHVTPKRHGVAGIGPQTDTAKQTVKQICNDAQKHKQKKHQIVA